MIELVNSAIDHERTRLAKGDTPYKRRNLLFDQEGLSKAGLILSKIKMEQTIFAEFPECGTRIDSFMESPTRNFDIGKLMELWECSNCDAERHATMLHEIGAFKKSGVKKYLIPVLYTGYLNITPAKKKFAA